MIYCNMKFKNTVDAAVKQQESMLNEKICKFHCGEKCYYNFNFSTTICIENLGLNCPVGKAVLFH